MATLTLKGRVERDYMQLDLCFHIINGEQITLSTDITDHIVEDHTMIQDHITIKPKVFTMRGLISEKVYEMPNKSGWNQWIESISNKLTPLKVLMPTVNSYFQSAINAYEAIENKVEQIVQWGKNTADLKNFFKKAPANGAYGRWSKNYLQGNIIAVLDYYRVNRLPVDIDTGWGLQFKQEEGFYFYITDIQVNQGDTYQESELSVTVKELRTAEVKTMAFNKEQWGRLYNQSQDSQKTVAGNSEETLKSQWAKDTDAKNNGNN